MAVKETWETEGAVQQQQHRHHHGGGSIDDGSAVGEDEAAKQRRLELNLSNEDIRASPRLLGYLFGSIGTWKPQWYFLVCTHICVDVFAGDIWRLLGSRF